MQVDEDLMVPLHRAWMFSWGLRRVSVCFDAGKILRHAAFPVDPGR
jgi:hypothetical protein